MQLLEMRQMEKSQAACRHAIEVWLEKAQAPASVEIITYIAERFTEYEDEDSFLNRPDYDASLRAIKAAATGWPRSCKKENEAIESAVGAFVWTIDNLFQFRERLFGKGQDSQGVAEELEYIGNLLSRIERGYVEKISAADSVAKFLTERNRQAARSAAEPALAAH
jgi:hypothetical protein